MDRIQCRIRSYKPNQYIDYVMWVFSKHDPALHKEVARLTRQGHTICEVSLYDKEHDQWVSIQLP